MNRLYDHISAKLLQKPDQRGIVLITILVMGMILTFVGLSFVDVAIQQYGRTTSNVFHTNAMLTAEAGIERTLHELNIDNSFTGYTSEQEFFSNETQGRGTYQTAVTAGTSGNEKIITATGRVYRYGDGGAQVSTRGVKVTVVGATSQGYSVHTGPGGLILSGSAAITNSEVHVDGYITMTGSARIGTINAPLNVNVAHKRCPTGSNPGSTYPQVCTSGQPISITGGSGRIYGNVCATNQTNSTGISGGNGGQGLIAGCVAPPVAMPTYDRDDHISRMTTTGSATSGPYTCSGSQIKTWPANLRLNGDLLLTDSCRLTVTGDVYITGNLTIYGSAQIRVADSLGTTRPVIVVDGKITTGGSGSLIANNQGTGFYFISYKSAASCGATCSNVTGTDLYNSQNLTTVDIGGSSSLAGMVFHAYWGKLVLGGSGNIGSIIGQTIDMSGSGTVIFGTSLSSGTSTWAIRSYQQIFE